jgi:hypothetical protein
MTRTQKKKSQMTPRIALQMRYCSLERSPTKLPNFFFCRFPEKGNGVKGMGPFLNPDRARLQRGSVARLPSPTCPQTEVAPARVPSFRSS